jgi:23S rRNA (guanosine2251-2'-O)-methyltransferase
MSGRGAAGSGGSGGRKRKAQPKAAPKPRKPSPAAIKAAAAKGKPVGGRPAKPGTGRAAGKSAATRGAGRSDDRRGPSRRTTEAKGLGGEQVEGRQAVRELLLAGRRRVREVLVVDRGVDDAERFEPDEDGDSGDELVELARDLRVLVKLVGRNKLAAVARTEAPQGVVAFADPLEPVDLADLATPGPDGRPAFLVAVDGVTDPGNLGALLRAAECAGVTGVVLPRHRAVHVTPTVAKAAAGAIEHLPMAVVPGLPTALTELSRLGVWSVGLDAGGPVRIWDLSIAAEPVVLVLGAEGSGLSRLVGQRCDQLASIPLGGQLGSLNVATAAAVACFEVARHRLAG